MKLKDTDAKGVPVQRHLVELYAYERGQQAAEDAVKGLHVYEVDIPGEPLALLYAKNDREALDLYKREFGILRFGDYEPKVRLAA